MRVLEQHIPLATSVFPENSPSLWHEARTDILKGSTSQNEPPAASIQTGHQEKLLGIQSRMRAALGRSPYLLFAKPFASFCWHIDSK